MSNRCGEPLPLKNQLKLVQLDGSPESSSAESEAELDLSNAKNRLVSQSRLDEWKVLQETLDLSLGKLCEFFLQCILFEFFSSISLQPI